MYRTIKSFILILFLCNCICISKVNAATINAASCSQSDVESAVNSASNGDTVIVPSGTAEWNDIDIAVGIILAGAGIDATTITASEGADQIIDLELGHNEPTRITGFTFNGNSGNSYGIYAEANTGSHKNTSLRIYHIKFVDCSRSIIMYDWLYGVIDHNEFANGKTSDVTIYGDASDSWARGGDAGTGDAIYIEDNTFTYNSSLAGGHLATSNKGARYVFRYNTLNTTRAGRPYDVLDAHGYCSAPPRGTYLIEIYENEFNTSDGGYVGSMVRIRGGRGVIFNNRLIGDTNESGKEIELVNYRSCDSLADSAGCDPVGNTYCRDNEGYPCKDQINKLYIWNNTINGVVITAYVEDCDDVREHIQEGRDYFTFQNPGYTPYEYPHPLTYPSRPSNLIIVQP